LEKRYKTRKRFTFSYAALNSLFRGKLFVIDVSSSPLELIYHPLCIAAQSPFTRLRRKPRACPPGNMAGLSAGFVAGSAEECGGATRFRVALHNCLDFLPQKSNSHLVCSGLGGTHERSPLHEPGGIIMTKGRSVNTGIATLGGVQWLP
jgi:hypothetical protein